MEGIDGRGMDGIDGLDIDGMEGRRGIDGIDGILLVMGFVILRTLFFTDFTGLEMFLMAFDLILP